MVPAHIACNLSSVNLPPSPLGFFSPNFNGIFILDLYENSSYPIFSTSSNVINTPLTTQHVDANCGANCCILIINSDNFTFYTSHPIHNLKYLPSNRPPQLPISQFYPSHQIKIRAASSIRLFILIFKKSRKYAIFLCLFIFP